MGEILQEAAEKAKASWGHLIVPSGGKVNYYLSSVTRPRRREQLPYTAECEDVISALKLTFDEACVFKEIWRTANARLNNGKIGHTELYAREKIFHYAVEMLLDALFVKYEGNLDAVHEHFKRVVSTSYLAGR